MKVDGSSRVLPAEPVRGTSKSKSLARVSTDHSERVHVSREAALLHAAREDERMDTAKIEKLRLAIESGKFEINPEAIADAMLREER